MSEAKHVKTGWKQGKGHDLQQLPCLYSPNLTIRIPNSRVSIVWKGPMENNPIRYQHESKYSFNSISVTSISSTLGISVQKKANGSRTPKGGPWEIRQHMKSNCFLSVLF